MSQESQKPGEAPTKENFDSQSDDGSRDPVITERELTTNPANHPDQKEQSATESTTEAKHPSAEATPVAQPQTDDGSRDPVITERGL